MLVCYTEIFQTTKKQASHIPSKRDFSFEIAYTSNNHYYSPMQDIITQIEREYQDIVGLLNMPETARDSSKLALLGKRKVELDGIIERITRLRAIEKNMCGNAELTHTDDADAELKTIAMEENIALAETKNALENELKKLLLPKDKSDDKDSIIEIRGGAGGDESSLFAAELFRMYSHYAEKQGWRVEILHSNQTAVGGFKEAVFEINRGSAALPVYQKMKYESGVHRVQRVPETEKMGRVHTSTATVVVLRPGRTVREHDLQRGAHHPHPERIGRVLPG